MSNNPSEPAYLIKTIGAILKITHSKITNLITVRKIRQIHSVESSNLSATRLYTSAISYLIKIGVLEVINSTTPKRYKLINKTKLNELLKKHQ